MKAAGQLIICTYIILAVNKVINKTNINICAPIIRRPIARKTEKTFRNKRKSTWAAIMNECELKSVRDVSKVT